MVTEQEQRAALRTMKIAATALLVLMGVLFILSLHYQERYAALAWVRAFSEAAMVGGLADWFAVTAIFRRPLGLPIPHTAIVPTNKERIGADLGAFVQRNFISPEAITAKADEFDPARRLAAWLSDPAAAARLADRSAALSGRLLSALDDREIRGFAEVNLTQAIAGVQAAPFAGTILAAAIESDKDGELLHGLLTALENLLHTNEDFLRETIESEMPWYVPRIVHEPVFRLAARRLKERLSVVNSDRGHPLRQKLTADLRQFAYRLRHSPDHAARGEEWKRRMLENPNAQRYVAELAKDMQAGVLKRLIEDPDQSRQFLKNLVLSLGQQLEHDEALTHKVNRGVRRFAHDFVVRHGHEISQLVSGTVQSWDTRTIVQKIELHVGRDLQYIRFNGTLVGGLVGVLIQAIKMLLEG